METEHFQASFRVITLGSIQIENNQIEKPPAKELTACMAALKVACYQTTQVQNSCDCREKSGSFLALHLGSLRGKYCHLGTVRSRSCVLFADQSWAHSNLLKLPRTR